MRQNGFSLLVLLLLCGCRVGPRYQPPITEVPLAWKAKQTLVSEDLEERQELSLSEARNEGSEEGCDEECDDEEQVEEPQTCPAVYPLVWWDVFHDPLLDWLEQEAIAQSPTLYKALEKMLMTYSEVAAAKSYLYPHINAELDFSQIQTLMRLFLPPNFPLANQIQEVFRIRMTNARLPFTLDYQVDMWGKLRSQYDSALHNAQSETAAFQAAILALTSEVAAHYFQLRMLDAELEQIERLINIDKKSLGLNESRYKGGLSPLLDVSQARGVLAHAQSDFEESLRLRNREENRIATLIGRYASEFFLPRSPLLEPPPRVPANLPSEVLLQRPDIAEAERTRAAMHDQIRVAYASFFPQLTLTGVLGYASPDLHHFLTWPSRLFSMSADFTQPIFEGGLLSANLSTAVAQFKQADATYREQVLNALQEVEDALQAIEQQDKQSVYLKEAFDSANLSLKLAQHLYDNGLGNYLQVSVFAQNSLQESIAYTRNLGARYVSTVQLIQSLGGSWKKWKEEPGTMPPRVMEHFIPLRDEQFIIEGTDCECQDACERCE